MFVYEIVTLITNVIFASTCTIMSGSLYTGIAVLDCEHNRTVMSLAWMALVNTASGTNSLSDQGAPLQPSEEIWRI
jgi:hypothetical protein